MPLVALGGLVVEDLDKTDDTLLFGHLFYALSFQHRTLIDQLKYFPYSDLNLPLDVVQTGFLRKEEFNGHSVASYCPFRAHLHRAST